MIFEKITMIKFMFIFIIFCIIRSEATTFRTHEDIVQYKTFLRDSVGGKPQAPITQKMKELQYEWERSGKFEGDILLSSEQINMLVDEYSGARNGIIEQNYRWPNKTVYYHINAEQFTPDQVKAIESNIRVIDNLSCLTFKTKTSQDVNYIRISGNNAGCFATVGYRGTGAQTLNLQPNSIGNGCFRNGTIIHELLHSLGFYHQQSTYNRDDYVKIIWSKIQSGSEHNFNKYTSVQVTNFDTEYDYGSVLHYSEYGFSIDGSKTIIPTKETSEIIGQRTQMSQKDITKLNKMYGCPEN